MCSLLTRNVPKCTLSRNRRRSVSFFLAFRPFNRGDDEKLKKFQHRLISLIQAARQNVIDEPEASPNTELYEKLKIDKKELREKDIEGPWSRVVEAGEGSDEVMINVFICLVNKSCHQPWSPSLGRAGKMWVYLQLASIIVITHPSLKAPKWSKLSLIEMSVVAF